MRVSADLMEQASPPRLKSMLLIVFLLMSTNSTMSGVDHALQCVTDYLFTINCSLRIPPSDSSSYWLQVEGLTEEEKYVCMLSNTNGYDFCSVNTKECDPDALNFLDSDIFEIFLCHDTRDESKSCELLNDKYTPRKNIKPNAPCCLTVTHNSNKYHFTWQSSYDIPGVQLSNKLSYELQFYERGHTENAKSINTEEIDFSASDDHFGPGADYSARVRSTPNRSPSSYYMGQWSEWSSEVYWKTEPLDPEISKIKQAPQPRLDKRVFIPLCVMVPLVLLLCYAPVKNAFIPTPEPYFQSLYSDCQGDFKSWVVTPDNVGDLLKAEETLQIDTMTKCAHVPEKDDPSQFHHQLMEDGPCGSDPASDGSLLGVPYAVSPGPGLKSLSLGSEQESAVEGDSGCWLCSDTSLEKGTPWYSNEYCTLSAFQESGSVMAEHGGSGSSFSIVKCNRDYQNGCHQSSVI
ncbi:interleukin-21 receptor isoform X2 [Centroberyx affinis]|uniref:interleukin-21 receptor isoform X2 n=1 Tax=Centroberyx affinis TaxID=166261 RepID=UPI003A5C2D42